METCGNLILHFLGRVVGVYKVAKVRHLGIAPVTAVSFGQSFCLFIPGCKDGFGYIKVLYIVYFIPFLAA